MFNQNSSPGGTLKICVTLSPMAADAVYAGQPRYSLRGA
ncbi:putative protease [Klebsiella pneumoniae]|uniref:Putative protease n=1 Tax=Klebsiella pneumoniae TaxID=573 RepID=A0A377U0T7_KLEPN|nr:putative protease [Klebsiella pneumoniae]